MQEQNPKPKKTMSVLLDEAKNSFNNGFDENKRVVQVRGMVAEAKQFMGKLKHICNFTQNNYALASKHFALGNYSDAIWRLNLVVLINPNHADAWLLLGKAYLAAHKKPLARKTLAKALALQPNWPEATEALAAAQNEPYVA